MNQPQKYAKGVKAAGVLVLVLLAPFCGLIDLQACGLAWDTPKSPHFDGVDEQGYVEWFEKVGELTLDKDLKIPLNISFRSDRETVSPYLGKGWQLPLLESHIVQLDERTFRMVTPDGWFWYFGRSKPTDTTIKGASNWAGEIRGNAITVWTDCGWKLEYVNGKIMAMSDKSRRIDFMRTGPDGAVTELRSGGVAVLRVETDPPRPEAKALVYGDQLIRIALAPCPPTVQGATKVEPTLKALTLADGSVHQFENGSKDGQPTLKIAAKDKGDRVFTWDAKTRRVIRDGDWTYQIEPGKGRLENAAIGRVDSQQHREFWRHDRTAGRETVEAKGIKTVKTWFTSGSLAGKLRKIEQTKDGKTAVVYQATYDEKGRLIRETATVNGKEVVTRFECDPAGNPTAAFHGKQLIWRKSYDQQNRLIVWDRMGKERVEFKHVGDDRVERTTRPVKGGPVTEVLEHGRVVAVISGDAKLGSGSSNAPAVVQRFGHDADGKINAVYVGDRLVERIFYDEKGKRKARLFFTADGKVDRAYRPGLARALRPDEIEQLLKECRTL